MLSCSWDIWCVTDVIIFHFGLFFALFTPSPLTAWEKKMSKKQTKKTPRDKPFTHVHHKSRSYDVWFLKYKVQRTEFFVILGQEKKASGDYHFTLVYQKWRSYGVWFLRYLAWQTEEPFLLFWAIFCPFKKVYIFSLVITFFQCRNIN